MTEKSRPTDALLTEHFRYTPLSLIDEVINTVNTIIYNAIEALESGLLSAPPATLGFGAQDSTTGLSIRDTDGDGNIEYPEASQEVEEGVHQLETLLEATVDKAFDIFEIYTLRNILTVPDDLGPWIRLGHYEDLNYPPGPGAPSPESILLLRREYQETQKLNLALRRERARNAALLSQVTSLLSTTPPLKAESSSLENHARAPFGFLATDSAAQTLGVSLNLPNKSPLTTHAQFTISQVPALQTLLTQLRPKLETLPGALKKIDWDSPREERRQYIEGRTRKFADAWREETAQYEDEGVVSRRIRPEEVESLESIVGIFGAGRNQNADAQMDSVD